MPSPTREQAVQILQQVPEQKAFFFYSEVGTPTGVLARSLDEFILKLEKVDAKVLNFHFSRGDFQKWIATVLSDESLSNDVAALGKEKLSPDELKGRLVRTLSTRRDSLKKIASNRGKQPK